MRSHVLMSAVWLLSLTAPSMAQNDLLQGAQVGNPFSTGTMDNFEIVQKGNDVLLIAANNQTNRIYAIDLNGRASTSLVNWHDQEITTIRTKIATAMGVNGVSISNMEYCPNNGTVLILARESGNFNNWALLEAKSPSEVNKIDLSNVAYAEVVFKINNLRINDITWDSEGGHLYYCNGGSGLNAELGMITAPFVHGDTAKRRATTMFKSNWGGNYFTSAPLEVMSYSKVAGQGRLMGVTTCAPGFSIPTDNLFDGSGTLQVTEDFDVRFAPSLKVVTVTQDDHSNPGQKKSYLYDLHMSGGSSVAQLVRVGEKFLDGSPVTRNEYNSSSVKIRTTSGAVNPSLDSEDAKEISTAYTAMAKMNEDYLLVIDQADVLKLVKINETLSGISHRKSVGSLLSISHDMEAQLVHVHNLPQAGAFSYRLVNLAGKVVQSGELIDGVIKTHRLPRGVFAVEVASDQSILGSGKILKQ